MPSDRAGHKLGAPVSRRSAIAGAALVLCAPAVVRGQGRSIRFWTWLDHRDPNPRAQVEARMVQRFTAETSIQVRVELIDWRTLSQQLLRAVAAGQGPDVTRVYSAWLPEHVAAGTLMPLDPMMARTWTSGQREDIGPPLPTYGGRTMAMYIENRAYMMFTRADHLQAAGVAIPKTFDEFVTVVQRTTSDRRSAMIWPASARSTDTFSYASPMIWAMGGRLVNDDMSAAFNEAGGVAFYSWLKDVILRHRSMPATLISSDEEVLQQAMNSGTCSIAFMGTNRATATRARLAGAEPNALQVVPAPSRDGTPPPVPVAGWCLAVTANSRDPASAFAMIDRLTNTEAQVANAREAGEMPVRKSTARDPWFATPAAAEMRGWMDYVAQRGRDDVSQQLVRAREFNTLLNTATQQMILDDRPVKEALDDAAAQWNRIKA